MADLSAAKKRAAHAWAIWVTRQIVEALDNENVVEIEGDAFADTLIKTLTDIAEANSTHRVTEEPTP